MDEYWSDLQMVKYLNVLIGIEYKNCIEIWFSQPNRALHCYFF